MPKDQAEMWTQLATRIPKPLHRTLRLHCVTEETTMMEFIVAALEEKLAREGGWRRRAGS